MSSAVVHKFTFKRFNVISYKIYGDTAVDTFSYSKNFQTMCYHYFWLHNKNMNTWRNLYSLLKRGYRCITWIICKVYKCLFLWDLNTLWISGQILKELYLLRFSLFLFINIFFFVLFCFCWIFKGEGFLFILCF